MSETQTRFQVFATRLPTPVHNWLYWHVKPYSSRFGLGIRLPAATTTELGTVVEGYTSGRFWREWSAELNGRENAERRLAEFQERIDHPDPRTWQPRIVFAALREREVTDWRFVKHVGTPDPKYAHEYDIEE